MSELHLKINRNKSPDAIKQAKPRNSVPHFSEPKHKRYSYQARALMTRFDGIASAEEVTQDHVDAWRAGFPELSSVYREGCVKAVEILTGRKFSGDRLRQKYKRPKLVSLDDLGAVYTVAKQRRNKWFCRFLRYAYITGLRHRDLTTLHRSSIKPDCIELEAAKTGKHHSIPRHPILMDELPDEEYPFYRRPVTVRKKLKHYCDLAGVTYFTPHSIRRTAITQYELARPGAGAVLQGSAISGSHSVTWRHYIDLSAVLQQAQDSLAIPPAMLAIDVKRETERNERNLMDRFRKMTDDQREAVLKVIESMS